MQKLSSPNRTEFNLKIKLIKYNTNKSGAYLFIPEGPAKDIDSFEWISIERGLLRSRVCTGLNLAVHCAEIPAGLNEAKKLSNPEVHIRNEIDLRQFRNLEIAMLVQTSVDSNGLFYTDLNGFQFAERKRHDKLTLQGNVYPMTTGAFIQDSRVRFSVLARQSLGAASLESGEIQVFLDRKLEQQDWLGLDEPMNDNVPVFNRFVLIFENVKNHKSKGHKFPSLYSSQTSNDLIYPIVRLSAQSLSNSMRSKSKFFVKASPPCDLHLVNLRTSVSGEAALSLSLYLRRMPFENCAAAAAAAAAAPNDQLEFIEPAPRTCSRKFSFADLLRLSSKEGALRFSAERVMLNLERNQNELFKRGEVRLTENLVDLVEPMEIGAFQIRVEKRV